MAQHAGWESKVRINGQIWGVQEWTIDDDVDDVDTSNTEGVPGSAIGVIANGFGSRIGGIKQAHVRITQATFDDANNPFVAPLLVIRGAYIQISIYMNGIAGAGWAFNSMMVLNTNANGHVRRGIPLSFTGYSDGGYTTPWG